MPPYGEPDWATPGDTANTTATQNAGTVTTAAVPTTTSRPNSNTGQQRASAQFTIVCLSFTNMGLAAMMGALGILSLLNFSAPGDTEDLTEVFLAVYMVIFASLLFMYELIWWQPIGALNKTFRKNFGFMYGLRGKGLYLIFIAFLCLGLRGDNNSGIEGLDIATGFAWLGVGCAHVFFGCTWPEAIDAYKPPSAGFNISDETGENVV